MEDKGNERLPQFPSSPDGVSRMEHLPTVEASIRYWEAVRVDAIETRRARPRVDRDGIARQLRAGASKTDERGAIAEKEGTAACSTGTAAAVNRHRRRDQGLSVGSAPSNRASGPGFVARQRLVRRLVAGVRRPVLGIFAVAVVIGDRLILVVELVAWCR